MAQWVEYQNANQAARVRIPTNTNGFFLSVFLAPGGPEPTSNCRSKRKGPAPWCGDQETGRSLGFDSRDRSLTGKAGC